MCCFFELQLRFFSCFPSGSVQGGGGTALGGMSEGVPKHWSVTLCLSLYAAKVCSKVPAENVHIPIAGFPNPCQKGQKLSLPAQAERLDQDSESSRTGGQSKQTA